MNKFQKLEKALRRAIHSTNEAEIVRICKECGTLPPEAADELPLLDAYVGNPFLGAEDGPALIAVIDGVEAVIEDMHGEKKKEKKRSYKKESKEKEARLLFLTS